MKKSFTDQRTGWLIEQNWIGKTEHGYDSVEEKITEPETGIVHTRTTFDAGGKTGWAAWIQGILNQKRKDLAKAREEFGINPDIYPELAKGCTVPNGPLGLLKFIFAKHYGPWGLFLPEADVVARRQGKICEAGWAIWYKFGKDEDGEFLDYYSSHRMTSDSHGRIHEDGRIDSLDAIASIRPASMDPVRDAELEKSFLKKSRKIADDLKAKGFTMDGDEPGAVQMIRNQLLEESPSRSERAIQRLSRLMEAIERTAPFPGHLKRIPLNETWFSDHLAWLLDVEGDHGYGTRFAENFIKRIALKRTDKNQSYARRNKYLRYGKTKSPGTLWSHLNLDNSAVFREFHLSNSSRSSIGGGAAFCDLAFLDLDSKDGILVAVENKLFTVNRPGQLELYFRLIEDKFHRARVLEYVYLTLTGNKPQDHPEADGKILKKSWIRMSWLEDVREILSGLPASDNPEVENLLQVLSWLDVVFSPENHELLKSALDKLLASLVAVAASCILAELQRLGEGGTGSWSVQWQGKTLTRLIHTSKPASVLYVGVSPNLSIVIHDGKGGSGRFEKLLIPFGSNSDQIYNLMDYAARDIYPLFFGSNYKKYLGKTKNRTSNVLSIRSESEKLFKFIHENRQVIQVLIPAGWGLEKQDD